MNEYEYEPVKGLPEELPDGEYIVWQGAPEWGALARRVFRVRGVAIYFLLLVAWYGYSKLAAGASIAEAAAASSWTLALGASALGLLVLMAWAFARSTIYTLTNKRFVMRFGVAIPMMINLPLEKIESADLGKYGEDHGDISLTLAPGERISYMALWPHARPWHYSRVKPMLRGLYRPEVIASLLGQTVGAGGQVQRNEPRADSPRPRQYVSTRPVVT